MKRGIPRELAEDWSRKYGSNVDRLYNIAEQILVGRENSVSEYVDGQYDRGVHSLPLDIEVPLKYAITEEMATTPADFFVRRSGALLFEITKVQQWKDEVLRYMTTILGWTNEQKAQYAKDLETMLREATSPANDT
ncbi:Aerobic glycerol-3-phosphate dehydrogenase [compost metagenome]